MYHGIIIDIAFSDTNFPDSFKAFAKRKSKSLGWMLYGIEISDSELPGIINKIREMMKTDKPYYSHFYNDEKVVVVFKDKVFEVTPNATSWKPIIEYGKQLGIPQEQLDFWPNRFQDEIHYFSKEDFLK